MEWQIAYYSEKVRRIIDSWPVGIRAFYARLTDRIKLYGPSGDAIYPLNGQRTI